MIRTQSHRIRSPRISCRTCQLLVLKSHKGCNRDRSLPRLQMDKGLWEFSHNQSRSERRAPTFRSLPIINAQHRPAGLLCPSSQSIFMIRGIHSHETTAREVKDELRRLTQLNFRTGEEQPDRNRAVILRGLRPFQTELATNLDRWSERSCDSPQVNVLCLIPCATEEFQGGQLSQPKKLSHISDT